ADLFLDTFYCGAHTTASDALWAGLPLVTCCGMTFASRVAASLLRTLDLAELITSTASDYEALALKLARNPSDLAMIREKLRRNRQTSPLFDTIRFTRHLEAVYLAARSGPSVGLCQGIFRSLTSTNAVNTSVTFCW